MNENKIISQKFFEKGNLSLFQTSFNLVPIIAIPFSDHHSQARTLNTPRE
jgi:hypothetical protein